MKDLQWELQCYGMSEEALRDSLSGLRESDYVMAVASMMSDAQQEIEFGMSDRARQTLNRAKFVLFNYVEKDEEEVA